MTLPLPLTRPRHDHAATVRRPARLAGVVDMACACGRYVESDALDFRGPASAAALAGRARHVAAQERDEAERVLRAKGVAYAWTARAGRVAVTTIEGWDAVAARG